VHGTPRHHGGGCRPASDLETSGAVLPHPFITLSFVTLAVIPELRLTDLGLVDVGSGGIVALQGAAPSSDEAPA